MISIKNQIYINDSNGIRMELVGKSTDAKPINEYNNSLIANGSSFFEMDTGNVYFYDEDTKSWLVL